MGIIEVRRLDIISCKQTFEKLVVNGKDLIFIRMKPINREELLSSREYWMVKMQSDLIRELEAFMTANGMNRAQLADYLGFSRGYITQLLSGTFDSKISKIVELSLAIGLTPELRFSPLPESTVEQGAPAPVSFAWS